MRQRRRIDAMVRKNISVVTVAFLLCSCGTTTQTMRLRVAAETDPSDAQVEVRYGDRSLATGSAPLVLDEPRDVTVHRTGGYWAATIFGGLLSIIGFGMMNESPSSSDFGAAFDAGMARASGPYLLVPGLVLAGVGIAGLVTTPSDPQFKVRASKSGYEFEDQTFEPSDAGVHVFLKGTPAPEGWPVGRYDDGER